MKTIIEPFKIKMVEPIKFSSREDRELLLRQAHFNLFQIPAEDVIIDLLTDSGTAAMSSEQWAQMLRGDESYAGARSWYRFRDTLQALTKMPHVLPTHQGRASERILFTLLGGAGKVIPSNSHFDTTRANIEYSGAKAIDLVIDQAYELGEYHPFKGNMDADKLIRLIKEVGREKIPLCMITITNNNIGGQPVSMANLKRIKEICAENGIPFFLDASRFAENAYFIQQREAGFSKISVREIVHEIFGLADGATISAKKDGLVNIGGVLLFRDDELAREASNLLVLTEGFTTYGGLAGRDLEAMAQGFTEVVEEDYLRYRLRSIEYLGDGLVSAGVPVVKPYGGHAIYIDAQAFCPHIERKNLPGQVLVCALYRQAGIRATELGEVMFGNGLHEIDNSYKKPCPQLVRLAIPRRVYTQSHMDYVIEAVGEVYNQADTLKGLEIIEEQPVLRHFTAKFKEVEVKGRK